MAGCALAQSLGYSRGYRRTTVTLSGDVTGRTERTEIERTGPDGIGKVRAVSDFVRPAALQTEFSLTYLFLSHDLGVVQHMCDRVAVMYMGKIVEYSDRMTLFTNPRHPYTKALLSAVPTVSAKRQSKESRILISGDPPDPLNMPLGCRFASRCSKVSTKCHESEPELSRKSDGGRVACHFINV